MAQIEGDSNIYDFLCVVFCYSPLFYYICAQNIYKYAVYNKWYGDKDKHSC